MAAASWGACLHSVALDNVYDEELTDGSDLCFGGDAGCSRASAIRNIQEDWKPEIVRQVPDTTAVD